MDIVEDMGFEMNVDAKVKSLRGSVDAIRVSVLTPAYNSELYLRKCLDSLEEQGVSDAEFICLNDGSTDGTLAIMREFADRDGRFVVVDKPNSGYGATMNQGLALARGAYVGILESDDYLEPDCLERLLALAQQNGCPDIVKANHYLFDDTSGDEQFKENFPEDLCGKRLAVEGSEGARLVLSIPAIWAALYRRDFLLEHGIGFVESPGASFQDTGFVYKSWAAAERVVVTHDAFLHYRFGNEGSSTVSREKAHCVIEEWDSIDGFTLGLEQGHRSIVRPILAAKKLDTFWWNIKRIEPALRGDFAHAARTRLEADRAAGLHDEDLYAPAKWRRLAKWIDDPEGLLLDLAISEEKIVSRKFVLRVRRKARKLAGKR